MATYKDLQTSLTLRWTDVEDYLATQRALIEVTPAGASLELPRGEKGEKGDPGTPGPQVWWTGLITDPSELPGDLTGTVAPLREGEPLRQRWTPPMLRSHEDHITRPRCLPLDVAHLRVDGGL